MASKRLQTLTRHCPSLFSSRPSLQPLTTRQPLYTLPQTEFLPLENPTSNLHHLSHNLQTPFSNQIRHFSLRSRFFGKGKDKGEEEEEEEEDGEDGEEEEDEMSESDEEEGIDGEAKAANLDISRTYSVEEKEEEAAAIGYKVIGPLDPFTERPFKWREPVFAVVQIGSHQFKVSNGDYIYTERLKFCEVNDKLLLKKVLLLGSETETIIGRPTLPEAAVYAVVEEHALDAKVIIFKKKRRKNYRRTKGHRQELTRLRITDIQGIAKPEKVEKPEKLNKSQRVAAKAEREAKEAIPA